MWLIGVSFLQILARFEKGRKRFTSQKVLEAVAKTAHQNWTLSDACNSTPMFVFVCVWNMSTRDETPPKIVLFLVLNGTRVCKLCDSIIIEIGYGFIYTLFTFYISTQTI
jgi:hypothetical protein